MQVYHDQDALHRAVNDIRQFKGDVETVQKEAESARAHLQHSQPKAIALVREGLRD